MDTQQIDVMVADASHEVYVDTILETIRNAAKVRGTGIAERTHEYVATKMKEGKAIIALTSRLSRAGPSETYQTSLLPVSSPTMAQGKDIQPHQRCSGDEDEYGTGLRARHFQ